MTRSHLINGHKFNPFFLGKGHNQKEQAKTKRQEKDTQDDEQQVRRGLAVKLDTVRGLGDDLPTVGGEQLYCFGNQFLIGRHSSYYHGYGSIVKSTGDP